jgi:phosphoribosylformylglycinamidine synthase
MTFRAEIIITLKEGVLDTAGRAVSLSLRHLGHQGIRELRMGRVVTVTLDTPDEASARTMVETICSDLLVNDLIEEYRYSLEKI